MCEPIKIAARRISATQQEQFAEFSGDRNPMHMDHVAARRTQAGSQVVHGVHTLLWALESLIVLGHVTLPIVRVKAKFLKWVYLEDEADLFLPQGPEPNPKLFRVDVGGMPTLTGEISYESRTEKSVLASKLCEQQKPSPSVPLLQALSLSFADLDERAGDAFTASHEDVVRLFPALCRAVGPTTVAELAACSYIVGMEAPGLHSMFSRLDLQLLQPDIRTRTALHYRVVSHDERFRKVQIAVSGACVQGALHAFVRVPPVNQASMEDLEASVDEAEFKGMKALVVGGSRGLGELTAKLIATGGGVPTITYAVGKTEAENVARQILQSGGEVDILPYDVRKPPEPQLAGLSCMPSHLFYFATNAIFRPKGQLVSPPIFEEFAKFYLHAFHDLCVSLIEMRGIAGETIEKLVAYYPSSIAVEERPAGMTEYSMVKAAGEQMCRDMNQYFPGLHIITSRLPRLHTDQTAGVMPERETDPIDVILPIIRDMYNHGHRG